MSSLLAVSEKHMWAERVCVIACCEALLEGRGFNPAVVMPNKSNKVFIALRLGGAPDERHRDMCRLALPRYPNVVTQTREPR